MAIGGRSPVLLLKSLPEDTAGIPAKAFTLPNRSCLTKPACVWGFLSVAKPRDRHVS